MTLPLPLALHRLHGAGKIKSPWLPGMLVYAEDGGTEEWGGRVRLLAHRDAAAESQHVWDLGVKLDLTDPATLGCLLALVREAGGAARACCAWSQWYAEGTGWRVLWQGWQPAAAPWAETEGAALVAALIALAEGVPTDVPTRDHPGGY